MFAGKTGPMGLEALIAAAYPTPFRDPTQPRRPFQFTLQTLMIVVTVVAFMLGMSKWMMVVDTPCAGPVYVYGFPFRCLYSLGRPIDDVSLAGGLGSIEIDGGALVADLGVAILLVGCSVLAVRIWRWKGRLREPVSE